MLTFVHEFRRAGYLPEAMVNFLALVGWAYDDQTEFFGRDELIRAFQLDKVSRSPAAFSYEKLDHMNATYLRGLGHNDLAGRLLPVLRRAGLKADFATVLKLIPLIRERIKTLPEALPLIDFVFVEDLEYSPDLLVQKKMDRASTLAALKATVEALASVDFDEATLEGTLRALADTLGLKVGQLFGCIRVACTGKAVAPPLFGSLAILGREVVVRRLAIAVERLQAA